MIHYRQRSYGKAVRRYKWCTSVEPNFGVPAYQRIAGKSRVFQRIGYRKNIVSAEGMGAEGEIVLHLVQGKTELGFKPPSVLVNDRDQRYWSATDLRSKESQFVEGGFRGGIQDVATADSIKSLGITCRFILWSHRLLAQSVCSRGVRILNRGRCRKPTKVLTADCPFEPIDMALWTHGGDCLRLVEVGVHDCNAHLACIRRFLDQNLRSIHRLTLQFGSREHNTART